MPITLNSHLKDRNNRSLLIVLSKEELDEDDCRNTLATYGSVRQCALTSDKRAAFVDFHCEHAPLLAARCFNYHLKNPEVPMPIGVDMLLPGCSFNQFLFLQHVPRAVANCTLKTKFSVWDDRVINLYRPVISTARPSSRVLVELSGKASQFTGGRMTLHYVKEKGIPQSFYAIPSIEQLYNDKDIEKSPGCEYCNIDYVRELIKVEEEKKNAASRDPSYHDLIHKEEVPEKRTPVSLVDLDYQKFLEDLREWFALPEEQPIDRRVFMPLPSALPPLSPFPPPIEYVPPSVPCETRNEETIEYPPHQDVVQWSTSGRSHQLNDSSFVFPFPISDGGYAPKLRFQKILRRKDRTRPTLTLVENAKRVVPVSRSCTREQLLTVRTPRESECAYRETPTLSDLLDSDEGSDENGDSLSPSERIEYDNIPLMHYEPRTEEKKEHTLSNCLFVKSEPRASQSSARQAPVSASAALIVGKEQSTQRVPPPPVPISIRILSATDELFDHLRREVENNSFLKQVSRASARDASTTALKARNTPTPIKHLIMQHETASNRSDSLSPSELIDYDNIPLMHYEPRTEEKKEHSFSRTLFANPEPRASQSSASAASKARNTPTPINEKENTRSEAPLASHSRRNLANVLMGRGNWREERMTGVGEEKEEKDRKKVEKEVKRVKREEKKVEKEEKKLEKGEKKVEKEEKKVETEEKKVGNGEKKEEKEKKKVTPHPPLVPLSAPLQEKKSEGMKVKKDNPLARILFGKKKERDTPSPSVLKDEEKEGTGPSFISLERRIDELDSDDEVEGEESLEIGEITEEQRTVNSSSSLTPRWSRSSVGDQDEDGDYRSSEYQSWLTRDYGVEAVGGVFRKSTVG